MAILMIGVDRSRADNVAIVKVTYGLIGDEAVMVDAVAAHLCTSQTTPPQSQAPPLAHSSHATPPHHLGPATLIQFVLMLILAVSAIVIIVFIQDDKSNIVQTDTAITTPSSACCCGAVGGCENSICSISLLFSGSFSLSARELSCSWNRLSYEAVGWWCLGEVSAGVFSGPLSSILMSRDASKVLTTAFRLPGTCCLWRTLTFAKTLLRMR